LTTDLHGFDTAWEIWDNTRDEIVSFRTHWTCGGQKTYLERVCLASGNYTFTLYDKAENGLCCENGWHQGGYDLYLEGIGLIGTTFGSNWFFTNQSVVEFQVVTGTSTATTKPTMPTMNPAPTTTSFATPPCRGENTNDDEVELQGGLVEFELVLLTDNVGRETSWELVDAYTNTSIFYVEPGQYDSNQKYGVKLHRTRFVYPLIFDIRRSIRLDGNGINFPGGYTVFVNGTKIGMGRDFADVDVVHFEV